MSEITTMPERGQPVVSVQNVSMAYKLYAKPIDMMKEALLGGVRHDTFWALRDISLSVCEGERLGIVGHNGAGKTTLLQVIARNLLPTTGQVSVNGRISSLLSQTPAWNGEESGLQNARFNLLMQGVPERRIPGLVEEIVDFTELGAFIYHPVKTYSSGMGARLMFAIATAIEPDILIIDEVLGAGDGYFAGKAAKRMQEFCARGRALLFVSHATGAVQQMCNKVAWIHNGTVRLYGDAEYVLRQYELDFRKSEDEALRAQHIAAAATRSRLAMSEELPEAGCLRFRIVADKAAHFCVTHFVRSIRIEGIGAMPIEMPLEFADLSQDGTVGALDVVSSEWGRLHERGGEMSRVLAHVTGRGRGGQFTVKLPPQGSPPVLDVSCQIESAVTGSNEELAVEVLDVIEGTWQPLVCMGRRRAGGDWRQSLYEGRVAVPEADQAAEAIEALAEARLSDVEIVEVYLGVDGQRTTVVKEREPFDLCVKILFRRAPPAADVGVKFTRADGVYVFWQSSGLEAPNLVEPVGTKIVKFRFNPNDLGAGEYYVSAQVANGWDFPGNYPYGQVYARLVNAAAFHVLRETPELDFGILNQRAAIEIEAVADDEAEAAPIETKAAE